MESQPQIPEFRINPENSPMHEQNIQFIQLLHAMKLHAFW